MERHVDFVLSYCEGNKKWCAQELGINVHTLRRMLAGKSAWRARQSGQDEPRRRVALRVVG